MPDALNWTGKEDTMQWNVWYDLMVLEMSDLSDPGKEKLIEAAKASLAPDAGAEDEPAGADDTDDGDASSEEPSGDASPTPA
jgi:hypothetical protein